MKVILQKDIPDLGEAGDIKNVAVGYARNYLIPKKMVILANESSKKAIDHQKRLIKIKKEKRKNQSEKVAESLSGQEIRFIVQVGEDDKLFGSVTSIDIAKRLKEAGFEVDKRKITLEEPIKKLGEYEVSIKLGEGLNTSVKVYVERSD